jgi:hypothetical protein
MVDVGHATIAPTPTHSRANSHTQLRLADVKFPHPASRVPRSVIESERGVTWRDAKDRWSAGGCWPAS